MKKQAYNPYLPSYEYVPDGEPYVFNDRVYIYGSHDRFNGKTFCMNNYISWSAPIDDLTDWRYEGVIFDKKKDPICKRDSMNMYAPDVVQGEDGKYYLYYFFSFTGIMSVAVCDTPAGEYQFLGHVRYQDNTLLGKKKGDPFLFDPAIFMDDDKRVYLYTGFSPKPLTRLFLTGRGKLEGGYICELQNDMVTVKTPPVLALPGKGISKNTGFEGHEFFEGSSIRKINGKYYYIYSSDKNHELCYSVSDTPVGPYQYGGTIISNADIGYQGITKDQATTYYGNNHGGIVKIKNQWYVFHHRQTNRHEYSRQTCAEKIYLDENGHFQQVEVTSCGLNNGPLIGKGVYSTHISCNLYSKKGAGSYSPLLIFKSYRTHPYLTQTGKDRENNPDQYVANIRDGAVVGFKYFQFDSLQEINLLVCGKAKGQITAYVNLEEEPIGFVELDLNNQTMNLKIKTSNISGTYPLYFKYIGRGSLDFKSFEII